MPTKISYTKNSGFVLLLTLVVVSVILAVGLSMLQITLKQLTISNLARESEIALHAASTGLECMQYHRSQPHTRLVLLNDDDYPAVTTAPPLVCADTTAIWSTTNHGTNGNKIIWNYQYRYNVGSDKCVETSIYLVDTRPATNALTDYVVDEGLSTISCDEKSVCTTIFSRGFNRSCSGIDSKFTVQRELTLEY